MASAGTCPNTLAAFDFDEAAHRHDYNIRAQNTIAAMIGFPSPRKARMALANFKKTGKRYAKRKYEIHKNKYTAHKALFDLLELDIMKAYDSVSEMSPDPEQLADPKRILDGWQQIYYRTMRGKVTPHTTQISSRKIQGLVGLTNRIMQKRNKLHEKGGNIPKYVIFIAPPQIVASWADSYGVISPIIEKVLRQSDQNVQDTAVYKRQIEAIQTAVNNNFDIITKNGQLNFKNGAMAYKFTNPETGQEEWSGVKGVRLKGVRTHKFLGLIPNQIKKYGTGGKVIIVGERKQHGIDGYDFVFEEPDTIDEDSLTPKWLPAEDFDKNKEEMQNLLKNKYRNELLYELGNGRVRYIVPKVIDRTIDPDNPGTILDQEIGADLNKLGLKLKQMQSAALKAKDTGVTTRVPGVHTVNHEDPKTGKMFEYRYVMIKQGEEGKAESGERYNLYLIDKAEFVGSKRLAGGEHMNYIGNTLDRIENFAATDTVQATKHSYTQEELDDVIGVEGFFKSDTYNDFGQYLNKENEPIYGTQKKQFTSFQRMDEEPNELAMENVWNLLSEFRSVYKSAWLDTSVKVIAIEKDRVIWDKKVRDSLFNAGYNKDQVKEYFDDIYNMGGIEHNLIRDEESGELRMPHTFAMPKSENYMPSLYDKGNIMQKQIPKQLERLEAKIDDFKIVGDNDKVAHYEEGYAHLQNVLHQYAESQKPDHNVFDLNRVHSLKHITAWTDPLEVRTDEGVMSDYLNNMYSAINRNLNTVEMLKALHQGNKIELATAKKTGGHGSQADYRSGGMLNGAMNYMVNRVKIAYGDPSSRAMTLFGHERSYDTLADNLNGLPKGITGGVKWDGKAAERFTKWLTAPMTLYHLGAAAAVVNNTQFVNRFIKVGLHNLVKTIRLKHGKDTRKLWSDIVDNTGVLNILSVFEDIMLQDGNPEFNQIGILNVLGVPVPMRNMKHFMELIWRGRQSFIDGGKGFEQTDEFLAMIEHRNKGKTREKIQNLREQNQLLEGISKQELRKKRGQYYDVWKLPEGTSEEIIKKRFKELVGDVGDTMLKQMVSWKLGWWLEGSFGAEFLTFTKTEENLRALTAISAILQAEDDGLLGVKGKDNSIYYSDAAVKIARNAVYAEQFGMTPPHMGEGFNGFGRFLWQYKQYPTQQIIHDYNILKAFTDGNTSTMDGVNRITSALVHSSINPTDNTSEEYDQEALQMGRFIFTRGICTFLGTASAAVPYLGWYLRRGGFDLTGFIRGGENPMLAVLARTWMFASLVGMGMGKDDGEEQAIRLWQYLLIPVTVGTIITFLDKTFEWFD